MPALLSGPEFNFVAVNCGIRAIFELFLQRINMEIQAGRGAGRRRGGIVSNP